LRDFFLGLEFHWQSVYDFSVDSVYPKCGPSIASVDVGQSRRNDFVADLFLRPPKGRSTICHPIVFLLSQLDELLVLCRAFLQLFLHPNCNLPQTIK
jgi:hypothetical protein